MAVTTDIKVKPGLGVGGGKNPGGGGPEKPGPQGQDWPPGFSREDAIEPTKYRILMWLLIGGVTIFFAALTSAYVFRQANRVSGKLLEVPLALWVTTGIIFLSSVSFEMARRALRQNRFEQLRSRLLVTTFLGLAFLAGQVIAWRQLVAQGMYLQSNPYNSFFYVMTGLHALHLLGGIIAVAYVTMAALRMRVSAGNRNTIEVTGLYWHFMGALWVFLFALLFYF